MFRVASPISALLVALATSLAISQTFEERFKECLKTKISRFEPESPYAYTVHCHTRQKTPGKGRPRSTETHTRHFPGHIVLTADATAGAGYGGPRGHGQPEISTDKFKVSILIWCGAEGKDFGRGGGYSVKVTGVKKRLSTNYEYRTVLDECRDEIDDQLRGE